MARVQTMSSCPSSQSARTSSRPARPWPSPRTSFCATNAIRNGATRRSVPRRYGRTVTSQVPVLFVTPVATPGGAERALAGLVRHLPEHGFEPHAVLLGHGPVERWLRDAAAGVSVIKAGSTRWGQ